MQLRHSILAFIVQYIIQNKKVIIMEAHSGIPFKKMEPPLGVVLVCIFIKDHCPCLVCQYPHPVCESPLYVDFPY